MKLNNWLILLTLWGPVALCSNEPVVARVNGVEIPAFRLERYFAEYLEDQGRAVGNIRNPKAYQQLRLKALDALIDKELLWQEAVKRDVVISDAVVTEQVEKTRQAVGGADVFARKLNDAGFDEASYTQYTRRELAAQKVFAEMTAVAPPDEQQVRDFYEEHRSEMNRPAQVQARHILIKVPQGASAATIEAARLRLVEVRREIIGAADFSRVAKSRSEGSSASAGGDLGYFSKGRMLPEFDEVAFSMAPGEISQPVRTAVGWHLIYVENHLDEVDVTEEQGFAMVRTYLVQQQQSQARLQVLEQLRSRNRIERTNTE